MIYLPWIRYFTQNTRIFIEDFPIKLTLNKIGSVWQATIAHLLWNPGNRHLYNLPGPVPLPFVGNALMFAIPPEEVIPVSQYQCP